MTATDADSVSLPELPARPVPARALVLSLAALLIPIAASGLLPGLERRDIGLMVWIAALVPAFLLSYYRGWKGSAVALAIGMVALALANLAGYLLDVGEPDPWVVLLIVFGFVVFSVGLGVVTELLHRARRTAEAEALTDSLTGLANRRYMQVYLEGMVAAARLGSTPLSLVQFDLDRFKWLNDTHGHAAGDEVLRRFASILEGRRRPGWLFARSGGEEFVGVLPNVDWEAAYLVADAVRDDLQDIELRWKPVTVSAGVATLTPEMADWRPLLEEADAAVYRAKELGRDRVEVAQGKGAATGSMVENPYLGPEAWTASRGIVVLSEPAQRRPIRRALELNGLNVEEWDRADQVPLDLGGGGPIAVMVTAARSVEEVLEAAATLSRAVDAQVPKIVFAPESVSVRFRTAPEPGVLFVKGPPTGEKLLAVLPRALGTTVVKSRGDDEPTTEREPSRLGAVGAPLTDGAILVVDDERSNRLALQRSLAELGFRSVLAVSSGEEAIEHVRGTNADLLVLDLHMPTMDGFQVMEELSAEITGGPHLPVLVVTGDNKWETRQRALRMGARDFLNKPFDVAELGARVLNLLEARQLYLQMTDTNRLLDDRVRQRTWELERAKDEILIRLARAAEYRDDVTGQHAERVGEAAWMLGKALDLPKDDCELIKRAAPLHDIGKIAIPDVILMKPGRLTAEEFDVMKGHTTIGSDLLEDSMSEAIQTARVIALTHHERWDGSGYPRGLRCEEIPVTGRIVALADVLDALTHVRPYKGAVPFQEAVKLLRSGSGSQFDPDVVAAMERSIEALWDLMESHA